MDFLIKTAVFGGVGLFVLAMIIFPGVRRKLKILVEGFLNIFVQDAAKTPEGARAVYEQAIEELQDKYNQADDVFRNLTGELETLRVDIEKLQRELKTTESKCIAFVKAGDDSNARLYSEKRSEILASLDLKQNTEVKLAEQVEQAQMIHDTLSKQLRALKKEKEERIQQMILNKTMKGFYDQMDDLKRATDLDKLLGTVRDHDKQLKKEVAGAEAIHMSRTSTRISMAEKRAAELQSDDYLMSLKSKYSGGDQTTSTGGKSSSPLIIDVKQRSNGQGS